MLACGAPPVDMVARDVWTQTVGRRVWRFQGAKLRRNEALLMFWVIN
jgi:hypothetical protein